MATTKGLVVIKTEGDLQAEEKKRQLAHAEIMDEGTIDRLANYIKSVWIKHRNYRTNIDDRLMYCLRSRKGEYSASELSRMRAKGGLDPVYYKLTGVKCRAASAWVRDILLPPNVSAWALDPTTIPDLPPDMVEHVKAAAMQELQAMQAEGVQLTQQDVMAFVASVRDKTLAEIQRQAKKSAKRVEQEIKDNMEEGDWQTALEEFIEDFVTYPAAFLKGPYYKKEKVLSWGAKGEAVVKEEVVRCWRRISPFDAYPAPFAKKIKDSTFIEHLRLEPSQIYDMLDMPGYKNKEIRKVLEEFSSDKSRGWLWRNFDREQLYLEDSIFASEADTIDAVHFWGKVIGRDLVDWGINKSEIPDEDCYYEIDAILINNSVIRAVINDDPLGERPYHSACWDAIPSSLWGVALPEHMEDNQKIINACLTSLMMNLAISSGPQAVVLADMIAEGEDITDIYPFKIWQARSPLTGNSGNPVTFFQPENNATVLLSVMDTFEQKADDVTNVPRYSYGNEKVGGAGSTARGLSMLMNSTAKGIRRAIANVDSNTIAPSVYQTFAQIMQDKPDPTLRGDCRVVARGAAAVLIKEELTAQRKEFLQLTANDYDMKIMGEKGRAAILREFANELAIESQIVPTEEEMNAQGQQPQIPPEIQQMQAELEQQLAQVAEEKQKLDVDKAKVEKQAAQVLLNQATATAAASEGQTDLAAELANIEAREAAVSAERKLLEARKEKLDAMQARIEAQNLQSEAELERRLAQGERRVATALVDQKVQAAVNKVEGIEESKEKETQDAAQSLVDAQNPDSLQKAIDVAMERLEALNKEKEVKEE